MLALFPEFELAECAVASTGPTLTGLVGFTGPLLNGSLGLMASEEILLKTAPTDVEFDARDWIGELANQALGRIKIAMLRSGLEIHASTPVVMSGASLRVARSDHVRTFVLRHVNDVIHLWIDYAPAGEIDPEKLVPIDAGEILDAGDCLLF